MRWCECEGCIIIPHCLLPLTSHCTSHFYYSHSFVLSSLLWLLLLVAELDWKLETP